MHSEKEDLLGTNWLKNVEPWSITEEELTITINNNPTKILRNQNKNLFNLRK